MLSRVLVLSAALSPLAHHHQLPELLDENRKKIFSSKKILKIVFYCFSSVSLKELFKRVSGNMCCSDGERYHPYS